MRSIPPRRLAAGLVALACVAAIPATALQNMEELKQMKAATTDLNIPSCRKPAAMPTPSGPR